MKSGPNKKKTERHGRCGTPEYKSWEAMINRCECQKATDYHRYGGRGIRVCDAWRQSFIEFLSHVGIKPSRFHSLDRFPNSNGNYEPGNVRWATSYEQSNNCISNHKLTVGGVSLGQNEWARRIGVTPHAIDVRLIHGWTLEEAVTLPKGTRRAKRAA